MNRKAFIVSLYFVALFIVLRAQYKHGQKGIPEPGSIAGPSYLYGVLALTSDFLQDLPTVLAAGLTVGLYYATHKQPTKGKSGKNQKPQPRVNTRGTNIGSKIG